MLCYYGVFLCCVIMLCYYVVLLCCVIILCDMLYGLLLYVVFVCKMLFKRILCMSLFFCLYKLAGWWVFEADGTRTLFIVAIVS